MYSSFKKKNILIVVVVTTAVFMGLIGYYSNKITANVEKSEKIENREIIKNDNNYSNYSQTEEKINSNSNDNQSSAEDNFSEISVDEPDNVDGSSDEPVENVSESAEAHSKYPLFTVDYYTIDGNKYYGYYYIFGLPGSLDANSLSEASNEFITSEVFSKNSENYVSFQVDDDTKTQFEGVSVS